MHAIYHIATVVDWEQASRDGTYTTSTRDRTLAEQGFIHGSIAAQVAPVANMVYRGLSDLVLLVIATERVTAEIRHELVPGWETPFPHIYGPLNIDAVVCVLPFTPEPDGSFTFSEPSAQ